MPACAGSCCAPGPYRCPCILILSLPPRCKLSEEPAHTRTSLDAMHIRQVPNSCLLATGWVPERRGGVASSIKNRSQFSTSSTTQLPGYCPRPGRHLLWVISICMAIITAFGKKIPLSKSPAELLMPAQNWRRQLRQTPSRLLLITDKAGGCLSPMPHMGPQESRATLGSVGHLLARDSEEVL